MPLCGVAQVYDSLPDGDYALSITVRDLAGNAAPAPLTRSWSLLPAFTYAQITGVNASASLVSFKAYSTSEGPIPPCQYEHPRIACGEDRIVHSWPRHRS